jgi:hypothetical protein
MLLRSQVFKLHNSGFIEISDSSDGRACARTCACRLAQASTDSYRRHLLASVPNVRTLRVETLINVWFVAHLLSKSSMVALFQL